MNGLIDWKAGMALGMGLAAAATAGTACAAAGGKSGAAPDKSPAPVQAAAPPAKHARDAGATAAGKSEDELARLFAKPLIIGASVSADWGTASPSRRASLRYTKPDAIRSHAQGGRQGHATVAGLPESALRDRSVILAMDLFFWDTTQVDPETSLRALDEILVRTTKARVPLVLGDVPELLAGRQPSRARINERIHATCAATEGCSLWKLDDIHRRVLRDGHLMIGGKPFTMAEIVPDGLHLSAPAGEWLADRLVELVRGP